MDELAKRFADLAEKFGPQVADAAMQAARTEAYSCLMGSLLWFLAATLTILFGRYLLKRARTIKDFDSDIRHFVAWAILVVGVLLAFPGLWIWVDPWTWTTLAHPELWIAKRAFHL